MVRSPPGETPGRDIKRFYPKSGHMARGLRLRVTPDRSQDCPQPCSPHGVLVAFKIEPTSLGFDFVRTGIRIATSPVCALVPRNDGGKTIIAAANQHACHCEEERSDDVAKRRAKSRAAPGCPPSTAPAGARPRPPSPSHHRRRREYGLPQPVCALASQ